MAVIERMAAIRVRRLCLSRHQAGSAAVEHGMLMQLRRMGRGDLTVHGFRSAFSDWCAERTNFPAEVREMALAHAVGPTRSRRPTVAATCLKSAASSPRPGRVTARCQRVTTTA